MEGHRMQNMKGIYITVIAAVSAVAIGLMVAGALRFRYTHRNVIAVKGSAEQTFESDLIVWTGSFVKKSKNLKDAYRAIKEDEGKIRKYLLEKGLEEKSLIFSSISTRENWEEKYNKEGRIIGRELTGYTVSQNVKVESPEIDKIEAISRQVTDLIETGVEFTSQPPAFYYTKLAELKIDLVGRAAADARTRAETVVKNTGGKIGQLKESSVGIFQIVGKNSGDAYTYMGAYNTTDRQKSAQVTVNVEFAVN